MSPFLMKDLAFISDLSTEIDDKLISVKP